MSQSSNESSAQASSEIDSPGNHWFPRGVAVPPHSPIFWVQNKDRYLRQLLIRDIEALTGRPLCVYFSNSNLRSEITQDDVARLLEMIGRNFKRPFDLLIETAGGDTDAAEALVSMLRSFGPPGFRAIVPNRAKSNGTLLCLAASEIVMGVTSELGPIEPSVEQMPATILDTDEWKSAGFSMHMLGKHALAQTRKVAIALLATGMLQGKDKDIEVLVEVLCTRKHFHTHGSVINYQEARRLGLNVTFLDHNDDLWRHLWLLYCMYDFDSRTRGLGKIFEERTYSLSVTGPDPQTNGSTIAIEG